LVISFDGEGLDTLSLFIIEGIVAMDICVFSLKINPETMIEDYPSAGDLETNFDGMLIGCLNFNVAPNPPVNNFINLLVVKPGESNLSNILASVFVQGGKQKGGSTNVGEEVMISMRNLGINIMSSFRWDYTFGFIHEGGIFSLSSKDLENAFNFGKEYGRQVINHKKERESQFHITKQQCDKINFSDKISIEPILKDIYESLKANERDNIAQLRKKLEEDFSQLGKRLEARFEELERRLEARFERRLEARFEELERRLEARFEELERRLKAMLFQEYNEPPKPLEYNEPPTQPEPDDHPTQPEPDDHPTQPEPDDHPTQTKSDDDPTQTKSDDDPTQTKPAKKLSQKKTPFRYIK